MTSKVSPSVWPVRSLQGTRPRRRGGGRPTSSAERGGGVTFFPGAYDYAYRPLLAHVVARLGPRLSSWRGLAHRLLGRSA